MATINYRGGDSRRRVNTPLGWIFCVTIAILFCWGPGLYGQQEKPNEYQVKAAYLYNFSRFVKWPDAGRSSKTAPLTICVLGKDPFGPALESVLNSADPDGKRLVSKQVADPANALDCQILFVADSEEEHLKQIFGVLNKSSVLTVSDIPQFSDRGGMIEFVLEGDKVRFEVNLRNAAEAGLNLSAELLKVALKVTARQGA